MSSIAFWHKRTEKVSSDSASLSFDFMSTLSYMAALTASAASRDKILEWTIAQPFKTAIYFKQAYLLVKRLGFEYTHAFQVVAKQGMADNVRSLLLRFASSMVSGTSELDFLKQEARVEREAYTSGYLRRLESMQKWSDAYAALLVSVVTIIVINMITTMLFPLGDMLLILLSVGAILVAAVGAWIIYKAAPYEIKTYRSGHGPRERHWAIRMFFLMLPLGVALGVFLLPQFGLGIVFLAVGTALIPSGILAFLDDQKINKLDRDTPSFIRALGNVTTSLHSTIAVALAKLDRRSMGTLEPYMKRLQTRLNSQLNPDICWERFRDETGSELVNRTTRMLVDSINLGGEPDKVGQMASDYAMDIALLRDRRNVTSSSFAFLVIPLHGAMVALLVLILEVMKLFNDQLKGLVTQIQSEAISSGGVLAIPNLPFFQTKDLTLVSYMFQVVIIGLTLINSFAPRFATGGHPIKTVFYGSTMCVFSGIAMLVIPPLAGKVLT